MCRLGFCVHACFNTQPPEGGWELLFLKCKALVRFQHTAARRRLGGAGKMVEAVKVVSTHSRPKAAGIGASFPFDHTPFQHTVARRRLG